MLQVKAREGLWIVQNIFQPGFEVPTHRHTGPVWGYTTSGAWKYKEYDYVDRGVSFLYEPAGSVHTLTCVDADTEVWFHMYGANLNLDADGNVESVTVGAGTSPPTTRCAKRRVSRAPTSSPTDQVGRGHHVRRPRSRAGLPDVRGERRRGRRR